MKTLFTVFFLLITSALLSQENKLAKFFEKGYKKINQETNDTLSERNQNVEVILNSCQLNDTTGLVSDGEFLLFRQLYPSWNSNNYYRYISANPVSVAEYRQFEKYVCDSTLREIIYTHFYSDNEAAKMLLSNKVQLSGEGETEEFVVSNRSYNREILPMNWNFKVDFKDPEYFVYTLDFLLPWNERFYSQIEYDSRKFFYCYNTVHVYMSQTTGKRQRQIITENTATISNPYCWSVSSSSINDEKSVLAQTYQKLHEKSPVLGVNGMQAKAFCVWKADQITKELNKRNIDCFVEVTLPTAEDLDGHSARKSLIVNQHDYSEQWRITVKEFQEFVDAVEDSIFTEYLYHTLNSDKEAATLISYNRERFIAGQIGNESFTEFDETDRDWNRSNFALNLKSPIIKKHNQEFRTFRDTLTASYVYFRIDAKNKGKIGELEIDTNSIVPENTEAQTLRPKPQNNNPLGLDLNLGRNNKLGQNTGIRANKNLSDYIIKEIVSIVPAIPLEKQSKSDIIKGITYQQALAFYHWKYPIWKAKSGDNWQNFVFPTKEQFEAIQRSEKIIIPEHQLQYPSPTFHYVVHIQLLN